MNDILSGRGGEEELDVEGPPGAGGNLSGERKAKVFEEEDPAPVLGEEVVGEGVPLFASPKGFPSVLQGKGAVETLSLEEDGPLPVERDFKLLTRKKGQLASLKAGV